MSTLWYRPTYPSAGENRGGMVDVEGYVLTGSSGAIASSSTPGFTVTKTATKTGRYRCQLVNADGAAAVPVAASVTGIPGITGINVTILSPTADAAITTGKAAHYIIRNCTADSGYFDIQFFKSVTDTADETHADAELADNSAFTISFKVKLASTKP